MPSNSGIPFALRRHPSGIYTDPPSSLSDVLSTESPTDDAATGTVVGDSDVDSVIDLARDPDSPRTPGRSCDVEGVEITAPPPAPSLRSDADKSARSRQRLSAVADVPAADVVPPFSPDVLKNLGRLVQAAMDDLVERMSKDAALRAENDRLKGELKTARDDKARLRTELTAALDASAKAPKAFVAAPSGTSGQDAADAAAASAAAAAADNRRLRAEQEAARKEVVEAEKKASHAAGAAEYAMRQVSELQKQLDEVRQKLYTAESQLATSRSRVDALQGECSKAADERKELETTIDDLREKLDALVAEQLQEEEAAEEVSRRQMSRTRPKTDKPKKSGSGGGTGGKK
jgi:predicted  nucleic acid-binding Zn-ribbon protein